MQFPKPCCSLYFSEALLYHLSRSSNCKTFTSCYFTIKSKLHVCEVLSTMVADLLAIAYSSQSQYETAFTTHFASVIWCISERITVLVCLTVQLKVSWQGVPLGWEPSIWLGRTWHGLASCRFADAPGTRHDILTQLPHLLGEVCSLALSVPHLFSLVNRKTI